MRRATAIRVRGLHCSDLTIVFSQIKSRIKRTGSAQGATMDALRPTTWLLSLGLHAAVLVAFVGIGGGAALESGSGDDMVMVEQGINLEGLTELREAKQIVDIPPVQDKVEPPVAEDVKPDLANVVTSTRGEEEVVADERKPVEVQVREQPAQVATLIEQSSGAEQLGGDTTKHGIYLGRLRYIVPVTASRALLLLDGPQKSRVRLNDRPEIGALLSIDTASTVVLAVVSALTGLVPERDGEAEISIAEMELVGALQRDATGRPGISERGVTIYPSLGDRVRISSKSELEAFCGDPVKSSHLKICALNHTR